MNKLICFFISYDIIAYIRRLRTLWAKNLPYGSSYFKCFEISPETQKLRYRLWTKQTFLYTDYSSELGYGGWCAWQAPGGTAQFIPTTFLNRLVGYVKYFESSCFHILYVSYEYTLCDFVFVKYSYFYIYCLTFCSINVSILSN